ncbi:UPF0125 protein [Shewanella sp. NFH-SH190041]|uniref:RnfH family protein n=1 Tax=Shewanella sp. NFH-SH190041 TaxID=2950245 RepID=UPI0021C3BE2F|nr:RnfH family protein [Shewanella sp. NFH-SH190041]BDM65207.1 UPF0125 protein [Shewanella sp. NFH-SH190041]
MPNEHDKFAVDVIYAQSDKQKIITINVTPETTFIEAVRQSQMQAFYPDLDLDTVKLGTYSRLAKHDEILQPGMRVEIYRPLIADPKDARRRRAERAKADKDA